ncbi:GNAT family N-acetyltransferase [Photobacterium sp. NCIMB 13483]|uniref:GNAT family N-acetyltransferase n=1 Tax=Photobacterium sp. NCIMB 13483 TaxID=2022103 RepID=UPI000D1610F7|nr:GNAT family N-acetyltransferase [Photobacterium sp. NCIMB 13483]PST85787.1 GNAT family N-acetyltransferase [Photobacterium sp. NCIMB 13483]
MTTWQCLPFDELTTHQLYDLLKLRSEIFCVEQNCVYPDLDDHDRAPNVFHLLGYVNNELVAYLRLLAPCVTYDNVSIGRVVVTPSQRKHGLGHQLLRQGLTHAEKIWPQQLIEIGAQQYLVAFYQSHGFTQTSDMYLEDGIPHVDMQLLQDPT